ncbi:MAG: carboxypeptidase regulatory-like domain-containing protein [Flavobacterium sp.]|nr:carboxypeptidase regulatory-like domain-containing protein [Flavobacterium sp.]
MKNYVGFLLLLLCVNIVAAQGNKQNIRGVVVDKLSQVPLVGAAIKLSGTTTQSTITDATGNYTLKDLLPERYTVTISHAGYNDVTIPNVVVTSGKEVILDITMDESYKRLKDVVVTSSNKASSINKFATVSARTFSMEEVNRYAGGRSDPARLAANFAGVSTPDDSRNDIVIRGNSPTGVLWRIDGMNVTNPNHFASIGTTGGAVSALNTNLLKSSDFFTSAFPAEYGNAVSGVFDLGFRSGNTKKRETTLQFGLISGLEATTEGPLSKNKGSSYLVGYRYSVAGLAQAAGINIGTNSLPSYQDLSFKINSGTTKLGKFSVFGLLAKSSISLTGSNSGSLYGGNGNTDFVSTIGIVGVNHFKQLTPKSFLTSTIGINYSKTDQTTFNYLPASTTTYEGENNNYAKTGYNFSSTYNAKISSKFFLKIGIQDELLGVNLYYRARQGQNSAWNEIWNKDTTTHLAQAFVETKYKLSEKLTLNAGLHSQKLFLNNNSLSLEPRLGLKYDLNNKSSFSLGYGLHSQMQQLNMYAIGTGTKSNINLGFTKSHHFVLGYDLQPAKDWRIKTEVYYQSLFNVPVTSYASSYSILNTGSSYKSDTTSSLVNNGTGTNYGAELTIEKFFSKGYYGLFTASIYSSKYTGSDGVERNTAFNGKYVFNILAGKEWKIGSDGRNKFAVDVKLTNAGGRYYTPIDLVASQALGHGVESTNAYSVNYPTYFRLDVKAGYTFNSSRKKIAQSISLDFQNITNQKNVFSYGYDQRNNAINTTYQLGIFPNLVYKFQF